MWIQQTGEAKYRRYDRTESSHGPLILLVCVLLCIFSGSFHLVYADSVKLEELIEEALRHNPEILSAEAKAKSLQHRIPQMTSLPDPMVMVGYQNVGFEKYTYGKASDAQWMFSLSQMFPFPGKLGLKGEKAAYESAASIESLEVVRLKTVAQLKEFYFDLFLSHRTVDLIREKSILLSRIEDAALARYSAGRGAQQEVLMAQTEKYMLLEREEIYHQKIQSLEAMVNRTIGREAGSLPGEPSEPSSSELPYDLASLIMGAYESSPALKSGTQMVAAAKKQVELARKGYYPDFTVTGTLGEKKKYDDMWSITTAVNIPLFYKTKQQQEVLEAESNLNSWENDLESVKLMISSSLRDNYSMVKTAETIMKLYKDGIIPKTYQDFELALSEYSAGRVDALTVITRLKSLFDVEVQYWGQFVEREKAIARIGAIAGFADRDLHQQGKQEAKPEDRGSFANTRDTGGT
ncbi:MAG TPA: TolC family protein [Thermodesulfovibrionales bacterium]|nr:TolC family protein [Thermodesulfovibrionales bacterium]